MVSARYPNINNPYVYKGWQGGMSAKNWGQQSDAANMNVQKLGAFLRDSPARPFRGLKPDTAGPQMFGPQSTRTGGSPTIRSARRAAAPGFRRWATPGNAGTPGLAARASDRGPIPPRLSPGVFRAGRTSPTGTRPEWRTATLLLRPALAGTRCHGNPGAGASTSRAPGRSSTRPRSITTTVKASGCSSGRTLRIHSRTSSWIPPWRRLCGSGARRPALCTGSQFWGSHFDREPLHFEPLQNPFCPPTSRRTLGQTGPRLGARLSLLRAR